MGMIRLLRRPGLFQHLRVRLVVRGNRHLTRHLARPRAAVLSLLVLPRFLFEHGFVAPIPHALDYQIDIIDRDTKYLQGCRAEAQARFNGFRIRVGCTGVKKS